MTAELVHYEVVAGRATLTLDSPPNRNALSMSLMAQLGESLANGLADPNVRVLVLSHTGRVFCSGMDLAEARGGATGQQGVHALPGLLETLWTSPKPVVARIAGPARAGGVGIVAACDIAVAARSASFAFSEVRLGVVPAVISVTVLPRLTSRAGHELLLTGEVFDGARAAAVGLVNAVVDDDQLDTEVARYVTMLSLGAPGALQETKRLLIGAPRPGEPTMAERFAVLVALSAERFASTEGQEGIAAFSEKRPASWVPPGPMP